MNETLPERIAKYQVDSLLGRGAMGIVYKAYDSQIERWVAIKVLHDNLKSTEDRTHAEKRFLHEAKAAARCHHPNITTVFDFGYDHQPYIVMEYLEGTELKVLLRQSQVLPVSRATKICTEILAALAHAHEKKIVHRDIKPANIVLLKNGQVKVTDFGVAHMEQTGSSSQGFVMGTPVYMSPEGLAGEATDSRSDLYSVAVLYYELLTQCRPNPETTLEQNLDLLNDLSGLSEQSITDLKGVLRKALNKAPNNRFQTADEFAAALKTIEEFNSAREETFAPLEPLDNTIEEDLSDLTSKLWNQKLLSNVETSLARHIGPLAKHLVRKTCNTSGSLDELLSELSMHIPSEKERSQFMRSLVENCQEPTPKLAPIVSKPITVEPQLGDQDSLKTQKRLTAKVETDLKRLLAFYLGPLAGRMIVRHSQRSSSLPDLIVSLSRQIPNPSERRQFIKQANVL